MDTTSVIALIVIAVVLVGLLGVINFALESRRRESFKQVALPLGLSYAATNPALIRKYRFLDKLRQGLSGSVRDILSGIYRGHPVHAFNYQFTKPLRLGNGASIRHESCFLLEQDRRFPELRIYPVTMAEKAKRVLGLNDITMDAIEFSQAFIVRAKDREFATTVLHPRMMAFLLRHPGLSLEIDDTTLSITLEQRLEPDTVRTNLDTLIQIRQLMPEHLYPS